MTSSRPAAVQAESSNPPARPVQPPPLGGWTLDAGRAELKIPPRMIFGEHVVLKPRQCGRIAPLLRTALNCLTRPAAELVQTVSAIELLARRANLSGSAAVGAPDGPPCLEHGITTSTAAAIIGCSARNVRDLALRGTLRGCWDGKGWRFSLTELLEYAEQRRK